MTARARLVLEDTRVAMALHKAASAGPEFRVSWLSVVSLLRAVGHALDKVDAMTDEHIRWASDVCWVNLNNTKPEPQIFWGFIEHERNRFIKNYEHGVLRLKIIRGSDPNVVMALDLANAGKGTQLVSAYNIPPEIPDRSIFSVLSDGPFAGQSETRVARQAIEWWHNYLCEVERLAAQHADA